MLEQVPLEGRRPLCSSIGRLCDSIGRLCDAGCESMLVRELAGVLHSFFRRRADLIQTGVGSLALSHFLRRIDPQAERWQSFARASSF
jgi:hypothetical protein